MKTKGNALLISSLVTLVMLIIITSFAFAYFTADTSGSSALNVSVSSSDTNVPVFTAYSSGSLDLVVTTKDMLASGAGNNVSAYQNLYVTLIGGGGIKGETINCHYDIEYNWDNSSYTKSPAATTGNLKEYTIQVFNQNNTALSSEIDMASVVDGTKLLSNESISSSGSMTTNLYKVVVKIYNLNVVQNIYNNSYKGNVVVNNVTC